ncbi:hypothetical protein HKX48_001289 [Thoreauomyces humboldtii]|nr:hypothetical protein HKX48_001289 [Thoreauomyces humboldtii]
MCVTYQAIRKVTINDAAAKYAYDDPLTPIVPPSARKTANHHSEYRQQYIYALQEADEGELVIDIPEAILSAQASARALALVALPPVLSATQNGETLESKPPVVPLGAITVRVDFSLIDPKSGLYFVVPEATRTLERYPQLYTHNQACSARLWIPCMDRYQEQCTWSLDIITPRTLRDTLPDIFEEGVVDEVDEVTGMREGDRDIIVVCSGELEAEIIHPNDRNKKMSMFSVAEPVSAASIMFAVGPFQAVPIPGWMSREIQEEEDAHMLDEMEEDGQDEPAVLRDEDARDTALAFCLPGREEQVAYTSHFIAQALAFFEQYLGSRYPHSSYKQVFVEDVYNPASAGASIAIFGTHLLLDATIVEQTYETMRLLCRALVAQWFGHHLFPKAWADAWLMVGLTNYLVGLFLQRFLGKSEYKFRLQKDMQRVCDLDVNQPPIYPTATDDAFAGDQPTMIDPLILQHFHPDDDWASVRSEFISLKAPIVLYMLDRRMGKGMMRKLLSTLLQSAAAGELPNGLSTHHFLRVAKKITGKLELKLFADQWIYGSGCPRFSFKYNFNRKKMVVEFRFFQENSNGWIVGSTPKFTGPFMIRIHEPGGTYDTEVHIDDLEKQYDIQYHTKYKRIRRKTGPVPKGKKGAGDTAAAEDQATEDLESIEDAKLEFNGEEPDRLDFEWIRLDPDNDWICIKSFEQTDFMWASQLRKDRNVNAQLDAVDGLQEQPSLGTCSDLSKVMADRTAFYGIRVEAAYTLAKCCSSEAGPEASEKFLLKPYRDKYCCEEEDGSVLSYPKTHDFTELQEYFVKKAMVSAISMVRHADSIAPMASRRLLLNLLKFNDNSGNPFSDNFFLGNLIVALGNAFLPSSGRSKKRAAGPKPMRVGGASGQTEEFAFGGESEEDEEPTVQTRVVNVTSKGVPLFKESLAEIHRYRLLDRLIPSYHNSVTIACLEVLLKWMLSNLMPVDLKIFLQHARYGNFLRVRLVALDALFLLDGLSVPEIARFLLDVITDDPVPYVQYHVSKALAEIVEVLAAESRSGSNRWNQIRAQLSARQDISQGVWDMMNSTKALDHRVRFNLLRFCEYLYDPAPEEPLGANGSQPPRLKIKMPLRRQVDDSASEDDGVPAPPILKKILLKDSGAKATGPVKDVKLRLVRQNSLPPEQARDPDPDFRRICLHALTRLTNHPSSASFVLPVDASNTHYHALIKRPMDLHTAGRKVSQGLYGDELNRFLGDVRQIFQNCYEYNLEDSNVHRQAKKLQSFFEEHVVSEAANSLKATADAKATATAVEAANAAKARAEALLDSARIKAEVVMKAPVALPPAPETFHQTSLRPALAATSSQPSSPAPTPSAPRSRSTTPGPSAQPRGVLSSAEAQKCKRVCKTLQDSPLGRWFLVPVDPIALGIPSYLETIKHPMDLGTIRKKLDHGAYATTREFESDIRLMVNNSLKFNPPDTAVHKETRQLLNLFEKEWAGTPSPSREASPASSTPNIPSVKLKKEPVATPVPSIPSPAPLSQQQQQRLKPTPVETGLSVQEISTCEAALTKMECARHISGPFLTPVSKTAYPIYHELIKQPMDLSTIRKKLLARSYRSSRQFEQDVRLMLRNCYLFNREGEPVYLQGKELEAIFDQEWGRQKGRAVSKSSPATSAANSPANSPSNSAPSSPKLPSSKLALPAGTPPSKGQKSSSNSASVARVAPFSAADQKACARLIKRLQSFPAAAVFLTPVDPVALNIPQYRVVVKRPMDLGTVYKNLERGAYGSPEDMKADIDLVLSNCFLFNAPGDWVYQQGKTIEAEVAKEWKAFCATREIVDVKSESARGQSGSSKVKGSKIPQPVAPPPPAPTPKLSSLSASVERKLSTILQKLRDREEAAIFLEPVDKTLLPDYHVRIKKPMDLRTMQTKLDKHRYATVQDFERDMRLMISNCFAYNPKTSFGHNCGVAIEKVFNKEWKTVVDGKDGGEDATAKKRKRTEDPPSEAPKNGLWTGARPPDDKPSKKVHNAPASAASAGQSSDTQSAKRKKPHDSEEPPQRKRVKTEPPEPAKPPVKLKLTIKK